MRTEDPGKDSFVFRWVVPKDPACRGQRSFRMEMEFRFPFMHR